MRPIRTLIADDEPLSRERIRMLLLTEPGFEVVAECGDGVTAARETAQLAPDVVFLDVRMPGLDGLAVASRLQSGTRPAVVFATAFEDHAVPAYDLDAVDYLVKPITRSRFRRCVERVRRAIEECGRVEGLRRSCVNAESAEKLRIGFKAGSGTVLIDPAEISWIEAARNYLMVRVGGRVQLVRETLKRVQARLPKGMFVRVHRSALVRVAAIRSFGPARRGGREVLLETGERLPAGRRYRAALHRLISSSDPSRRAHRPSRGPG